MILLLVVCNLNSFNRKGLAIRDQEAQRSEKTLLLTSESVSSDPTHRGGTWLSHL